jgi:hypothetical protein
VIIFADCPAVPPRLYTYVEPPEWTVNCDVDANSVAVGLSAVPAVGSTMFDNDHVAFVKVVVPIEPEIVDVPLSSTYWYRSAQALDPCIANIVNAAARVSLPMVVVVESFIDFAFPMIQKVLLNTVVACSTNAILSLVTSSENRKITGYMSPLGDNPS